ncbi:MAG: glycosyltransferase [Melioribacteraceae bacterium]|nr:glycosyltransferase [Melioribacteraceae bacterium]
MKVLVLSSMYPNNKVYLSGVFVHEQVKELMKLGVDIDVIAPIPYSPPLFQNIKTKWSLLKEVPEKEKIDNVRIFHPRYLAIPGGLLKGYWSYIYFFNTMRILEKYNLKNYDLVHGHGGLPDDYAGYLISQKLKAPYVLTVHGAAVYATIKNKLHFKKSKKSLESADAVVGVSSKVIERVKKYSIRDSGCYTIHNGFKQLRKQILNRFLLIN